MVTALLDSVSETSLLLSVTEEGIIPVHSKSLAARPSEAVLFHASEKIAENLAFVMCSFGCNMFRKIMFIKNQDVGLKA